MKVIEDLENQLKIEKAELKHLLYDVLPEIFAEYGINECIVGNYKFKITKYVSPKIVTDSYDEAIKWINGTGYANVKINCIIPVNDEEELTELNEKLDGWDRIIDRKIHHKTLEAATKRLLDDGVDIPEELISVDIGLFVKINEVV